MRSSNIPKLSQQELSTQHGGRRVFVYFNLHKKLWSIRDCQSGRVICHSDKILLENATPRVGEAGRQRVIRENRKNVHAGIVGTLVGGFPPNCWMDCEISYNPYFGAEFFCKDDARTPYRGSDVVFFCGKRVYSGSLLE